MLRNESRSEHSCESRSITSTPSDLSHATRPEKFRFPHITTVRIPNWRINPLQYQQGASVVTITLSRIRKLPSRPPKCVRLSMCRIVLLHSPVSPRSEQLSFPIEHRCTNRNATFTSPEAPRLVHSYKVIVIKASANDLEGRKLVQVKTSSLTTSVSAVHCRLCE
jgi:hypothetical protein